MQYSNSSAAANLDSSSNNNNAKVNNTKCSWCDRKRARNDLCNVCRQKVESRARRLMEQKLEGDKSVIERVMKYLTDNLPMNRLSNEQTLSLFTKCFPFLMLKFQSENTYRGKKGNRCWCLPESVLKKLIAQFYEQDSAALAVVKKGGRNELSDLLMSSVKNAFHEHGIYHVKPTPDAVDSNPVKTEDGPEMVSRSSTKRTSMDDGQELQMDSSLISVPPPRKRAKMEEANSAHNAHSSGNHNSASHSSNIQPDHQIWGRSDTELLSFDIHKLDSFLRKFEREVLDGEEIQKIEPAQRINFLKGRCKEFTKILTELRDYVIHLRTVVESHGGNAQINRTLDVKDREIAQLKQRLQQLSNLNPSQASEILYRCVNKLLTRLSPNPVDTGLLRSNMDRLEQYHDLACNELSDAVRSLESIGCKLGCQRSSDQTLKDYAASIDINVANNNGNQAPLNTLYVQASNNSNMTRTPSMLSSSHTPSISSFRSNTPSSTNLSSYTSTSSQLSPSMINSMQNATFSLSQPNTTNNNNSRMNPNANNNQRFHLQAPSFNAMTQLNPNMNMNNLQTMMGRNDMNNNMRNNMNNHGFQNAADLINRNLSSSSNNQINRVHSQANTSSSSASQSNANQNQNQTAMISAASQPSTIMIAPIGNPFPLNGTMQNASFLTLSQPSMPFNTAAALNSIGIAIPTVTTINPGQHLPTRFNGEATF